MKSREVGSDTIAMVEQSLVFRKNTRKREASDFADQVVSMQMRTKNTIEGITGVYIVCSTVYRHESRKIELDTDC